MTQGDEFDKGNPLKSVKETREKDLSLIRDDLSRSSAILSLFCHCTI